MGRAREINRLTRDEIHFKEKCAALYISKKKGYLSAQSKDYLAMSAAAQRRYTCIASATQNVSP